MPMPISPRRRIKVAGGRLPYADHAYIDLRKLTDYALNPEHSKAHGFEVVLGLKREDAVELHDQIIERVPGGELLSIRVGTDNGWPEFSVEVPIDGHEGRSAPILTGWMVDERHEPWLVTTYVLPGSTCEKVGESGEGGGEVSDWICAKYSRAAPSG
jgi:hypothetical protein